MGPLSQSWICGSAVDPTVFIGQRGGWLSGQATSYTSVGDDDLIGFPDRQLAWEWWD